MTFTGSSKTSTPLGFRSFTTVNNTTILASLNINSLNTIDNESQPEFFFFPSANDKLIDVVLNDPAGYTFMSTNSATSNKYRVFNTGTDQLFELSYVGNSKFSFREVGDKFPLQTSSTDVTSDKNIPVDTQIKHNKIITLTNTGSTPNDFLLNDWDDPRIGHAVYIHKTVTTGDIVLKLGDATFPDGTVQLTMKAGKIYLFRLTKIATSIIGRENLIHDTDINNIVCNDEQVICNNDEVITTVI